MAKVISMAFVLCPKCTISILPPVALLAGGVAVEGNHVEGDLLTPGSMVRHSSRK